MTEPETTSPVRMRGIHEPVSFNLRPDTEARKAIAQSLGIRAVKKLIFGGKLSPSGARDVSLSGKLGATVVQECVVSGDPVTTRIDEKVLRHYLADMPEPDLSEMEMPEDENADPLPETLDLAEVMIEALALALPPWPRADGMKPVILSVTEPGKTPMTDEDAKPFAALKSLGKQGGSNGSDGR